VNYKNSLFPERNKILTDNTLTDTSNLNNKEVNIQENVQSTDKYELSFPIQHDSPNDNPRKRKMSQSEEGNQKKKKNIVDN